MNKTEFYSFLSNGKESGLTKIAVVSKERQFTYGELFDEIDRCSRILQKYNITTKTKIGLMINSHASFLVMMLACLKLGVIVIPIYSNVGEEKLSQIIEEFNVSILVSEKKRREPIVERFACMEDELLLSLGEKPQDDLDDDIVLIMMTSGTTNKSKGVMLSAGNIGSNILGICDYLKLEKTDNVLIVKNTNHISTVVGELLVGFYEGVTLVFSENIIGMNNMDYIIEKYDVTVLFAVPYLLQRMLNHDGVRKTCLRLVNFYGAKISEADIRELLLRYPNTNFVYSYGQTEAAPRVTYIERDAMERFMGSSGKPIKGVTLTIQDESGKVLGPDEEGEIVVSGPNVMRGYYRNAELTEKTVIDGQLHTGDLGYVNKEGYLFVTGRRDNMIIISGKNIHPEEIEEIVSSCNGVKEVLVKEKQYGGITGLICYVVKCEECDVDPISIRRYVRSKVEDYKTPREVVFVSELERTPSGKIKR